MKKLLKIVILLPLFLALWNCADRSARSDSNENIGIQKTSSAQAQNPAPDPANAEPPMQNTGKVIHVLVALCDNINQGIVPVPARLGNGEDLQNNLYWGAAYGVKAFFKNSKEWQLVAQRLNLTSALLERCVFKHKTKNAFLIADAYRGADIKQTIQTFFEYAAGGKIENIRDQSLALSCGGGADALVYVGHNGLMDFELSAVPTKRDEKRRDAIMLCCASKNYFAVPLRQTGAQPLVWTTNLMAPEAYVLKAAIDGWLLHESVDRIRLRAAEAYNTYQRCGLKGARRLFDIP